MRRSSRRMPAGSSRIERSSKRFGANAAAQQEHLRVLVGQLRKKLEIDPAHPQFVVTEPWVGYRLAQGG